MVVRRFWNWVNSQEETYRLAIRPLAEFQGIFLLGDPGTGKSQIIHQFLWQIGDRRPSEAGICFDPACEFLEAHFNPQRDIILNPLDRRCPYWSPAFEVETAADRQLLGDSFFPIPDHVPPPSRFFVDSAGQIFMHMLRYGMAPQEIFGCLCDERKIDDLVAGTELRHLIPREAKAQRSGVLGTLAKVGEALKLLPGEEECEERISLTEWARKRRGWIYVTSTLETRDALRPLQAAFLNILMKRLLSVERGWGQRNPCWLVVDEVHALKHLPALPTVLAEGRKYGVKPILGTQSKFQMREHYGESAASMIAAAHLKIFLRTNEPEAAKWISDSIGEEEWEKPRIGSTAALAGHGRNSVNYSTYREVRAVASKEQVMGLLDLNGYWKAGDEVVPFRILPVEQPRVAKGFMARASSKEKPLKMPTPPAATAAAPQPGTPSATHPEHSTAAAAARSGAAATPSPQPPPSAPVTPPRQTPPPSPRLSPTGPDQRTPGQGLSITSGEDEDGLSESF